MDEFLNLHCQLKRNGKAKQWEIKHQERKKKPTTANQKETWAATPPENFVNGLTDTRVHDWLECARGSSGMTHAEQATLSPRSQLRLKRLLNNSLAFKVGSSPLTTSTHPPQIWLTCANPACSRMAAPDQVIEALTQTPSFSTFPSILNELEVRFTQLRPTCPTMTCKMHQNPIQTERTCPCDEFHDSHERTLLMPPTTQTQTGSLLMTGKATPQRHVCTACSDMTMLIDKRNAAWKFTPHQALETKNKIHEGSRCVRDPSISPPQHLLTLEQDMTNFPSNMRRSHALPNSAWQKCHVKNAAQKLLAFAYEQESLAPTHPQPTRDCTTQNDNDNAGWNASRKRHPINRFGMPPGGGPSAPSRTSPRPLPTRVPSRSSTRTTNSQRHPKRDEQHPTSQKTAAPPQSTPQTQKQKIRSAETPHDRKRTCPKRLRGPPIS